MAREIPEITQEFLHKVLLEPSGYDPVAVYTVSVANGIAPSPSVLDDIARRGFNTDIQALEWWVYHGVHPTEKSYCWLLENTPESQSVEWFETRFPGLITARYGAD